MSKPLKNINELLSQGLENHRAKRFTMAKQLYLEILEECPQHPDALNLLGTAIAQDDEPEKAIQFIQQAILFRPELAPYRVNLGVVFQDLGRFDQAEASFQYAIQLDEKFVDAYYNLAKLYKQVEKPISAIKTYKKLLSLAPQRQDALINMGNIYFDDGSLEKAITYFKKASLINSGNEQLKDQAIINLGNTYRRKGQDLDSIRTYERVLSRSAYPGLRIKQAITLPIVYRDKSHIDDVRLRFERELETIENSHMVISDPALEISSTNFFLAYQSISNKVLQKQTAKIMLKACPSLDFIAPHSKLSRSHSEKIKIGFISAYFRQHSIGRLMQGLIENISKTEFEIIIFTPKIHIDAIANSIYECAESVVPIPDDTFEAQEKHPENK